MPKIVEFSNNQQLENWINEFASIDKYKILITEAKELILRPTKATDTLDFGYIKFLTKGKLEGVVNKLIEQGYKWVEIKAYHWNTERGNIVVTTGGQYE